MHVVAAARADADDRRLEVAHEPGVGAGGDLDPTAAQAQAGGAATDIGDPSS
jgi:hypothetical protein